MFNPALRHEKPFQRPLDKDNILLVANWESDVGYAWWLIENFWLTIAEHFGEEGKKSVLAYPKITRLPESIRNSSIKVTEHDFRKRSANNLKQLHGIIRANHIKYLYLSDRPTYSPYYVLLRLWGVKKIVVHDHTPGDRSPATSWKRLLKSAIQRVPYYTADHFIAVTDFVYKRFQEVSCIPAYKCSCAPNGINPIDKTHADPEYARKTFNIPDNRSIVVSTGRASHYKGIDFFIECANELIHHRLSSRLHFLFCGDGPEFDHFRAMVKKYRLESFFTFAGKRADIRAILPACDIGFHASKGEVGYSLSILEYMSAGLVTVVPDLPSTSLAVTHRDNGIIYKAGDIASAVDAIETALNGKGQSNIRNNAARIIQEKYNIRFTNQCLTGILETVFS